ncbi:MAG: ribosomal RNA small subunit methyltransferase A [Phycisphaerales bacterium JB063]
MAQTLSDIKRLLADHGLRPKKKFGQNFLHDGNHMAKIMDAAALSPGDVVLEVGPGTGALTERLVDAGAKVVAVEIDRDMEPILRGRLGERITLHVGDALDGKHAINPAVVSLLAQQRAATVRERTHPVNPSKPQGPLPDGRGSSEVGAFKLIANLPYHIASPLLANLALDYPAMSAAVVMIQKEVADRLTASPGTKAYGPLGILLQAVFEVSRVGVLKPGCFYPPPSIDSAVVVLHRRPTPLCDDPHAFSKLLHTLFSKRRKQLGAILGRDTPLPEGVEPTMRPEVLTLTQLAELAMGRT